MEEKEEEKTNPLQVTFDVDVGSIVKQDWYRRLLLDSEKSYMSTVDPETPRIISPFSHAKVSYEPAPGIYNCIIPPVSWTGTNENSTENSSYDILREKLEKAMNKLEELAETQPEHVKLEIKALIDEIINASLE